MNTRTHTPTIPLSLRFSWRITNVDFPPKEWNCTSVSTLLTCPVRVLGWGEERTCPHNARIILSQTIYSSWGAGPCQCCVGLTAYWRWAEQKQQVHYRTCSAYEEWQGSVVTNLRLSAGRILHNTNHFGNFPYLYNLMTGQSCSLANSPTNRLLIITSSLLSTTDALSST